MRQQHAGETGERRRDRKRRRLGASQVDAHTLGGYLGVPHGDEGATHGAAQQIRRRKQPRREEAERNVVQHVAVGQADAEELGLRDGHAAQTAGDRFPVLDAIRHDAFESQGGDRQ